MIQPLTPEVHQMVVSYNLGIPTAEYRAKFTTRKAISVAFLFVGGLAFLVMTILGSSSLLPSALIAVLILSVMCLGTSIWIVVDAIRSRDKRVYVCPGGLLYQHNGKSEAIRWEQVEIFLRNVVKNYRNGIYIGTTHRYTLQRYDGTTIKFNDNIYNVEALGNTIASETARVLWPRYITAYQAGQTLPFGKISLNQQGVNNGKEVLPWYQIKEIQVNRGLLTIKKEGDKQGNWMHVQTSEIPNLDVFMALVNYIQSSKRR